MIGWLVVSLRRLRVDGIAALGLAVLVFVTSFAAALAPRVHERVGDGALRDEISQAPAAVRNLRLLQVHRYDADAADPMRFVDREGEALYRKLPESLKIAFPERIATVETTRWSIEIPTPDPSFLLFRVQPTAADHVRYVEGRAPGTDVRIEPSPNIEEVADRPFFEVGLSVKAAAAIGVELGDSIPLEADESDRLVGRGGPELPFGATVVGLFEPLDAADPYWSDDPNPLDASVRALTLEVRFFDVTALLAPETYATLLEWDDLPMRTTWRFPLDVSVLNAAGAPTLLEDLRRLETIYPASEAAALSGATTQRTGLLRLLETQTARWRSADAVLSVVASGPTAVAIAALALVSLLAVRRRWNGLVLSRGRGASAVQVVLATLVEGLLVVGPALAVAVVAAAAIVPNTTDTPSRLAAGGIALAALIVMILVALPSTVEPPRRTGREGPAGRRASARRLVFEGLIVVLAAGGAWLLRDRGIRGASSVTALAGADPLLAAAPALAGLAAGIVATRVFPVPVRLFGGIAAAGRSFVPLLAFRRTAQSGTSGAVLIVLLATAIVGTFGSAVLVHLSRSAEAVGWQRVGAAHRLDALAGRFPDGFDPGSLPGVTIAAQGYETPAVLGTRGVRVEFLAIDAAAYRRVIADTPLDGLVPEALALDSEAPFPAIVSADLIGRDGGLSEDSTFDLILGGYHPRFRVVDIRASFPFLELDRSFVVVSRDQLLTFIPESVAHANVAFLRAPDAAEHDIRVAFERAAPGATMVSRADATATIAKMPVIGAVTWGVAIATLIAAAYAALAVAAAVALAAAARADEVAHLSVLGLTRRQAAGLVILEHGPTVVFAFVVGAALGLGLFAFVRPGLGLAAILGSALAVPLVVEPLQLALVFGSVVAVVVIGLALGTLIQGRAVPVAALRRGMEG